MHTLRRSTLWILGLLLAGSAGPAAADELQLSLESDAEYDSNIFRQGDDVVGPEGVGPQDEFVFRNGARISLDRRNTRFTYNILYQPAYEKYVRFSGLDTFTQRLRATVGYQISRFTSISVTESFSLLPVQDRDPVDDGAAGEVVLGREEVVRSITTLNLTHNFSSRLQANLVGSYSFRNFDGDQRQDDTSYSGQAFLTYQLNSQHRLGLGGVAQFRQFDAAGLQPESQSTIYQGFGIWEYEIDPTFRLTARGGPAWTDVQRDSVDTSTTAVVTAFPLQPTTEADFIDATTCPTGDNGVPFLSEDCDTVDRAGGPPPDSIIDTYESNIGLDNPSTLAAITTLPGSEFGTTGDPSLTFFGSLQLVKQWDRVTASAGYNRREQATSGLGTSSTIDSLSGTAVWQPDRNWEITGTITWSRRQTLGEFRGTVQTLMNAGAPPDFSLPPFPASLDPGIPIAMATGLSTAEFENDFEITALRYRLTVQRRLARNLFANLRVDYLDQEAQGDFATGSGSFDRVRVVFGVRYDFDPFRFGLPGL